MAKGLLYFAQNSAFQHLTKIGKTKQLTVEDRGLSASNVPEDFGYLAVFECDDADQAEKYIHEKFKGFRHYTQTKRKTEFFWSGCIEEAIDLARHTKGMNEVTEKETEEIEIVDNAGETQIKKIATRTTFEMIQLPINSKIFFKNDKNKCAIVLDKKNQVQYNGQKSSISNLALKLEQEIGGNSKHINGFSYFYYNDKSLFDMRPDQQEKH